MTDKRKRFSYIDNYAIDWHVHTDASDGIYPPYEVVRKAKKAGLKEIAITDHDTTAGFEEAKREGKKLGVRVIPGIEFTCYDGNIETHIKGLDINPKDPGIMNLCVFTQKERAERAKKIIKKLDDLGYDINWGDIQRYNKNSIGRPQIARALLGKRKNLERLKNEYSLKCLPSKQEVFAYLIGKGKPAYAEKAKLNVPEVIKAIHKAGGIAELSHPGGEKGVTDFVKYAKIKEYKQKGLDALEVYYTGHDDKKINYFADIARKLDLIATGGSDFHGDEKDNKIGLGRNNLKRFWKKI